MLENERIIVDRGGIDPGIAALMQNANKGFDPAALMASRVQIYTYSRLQVLLKRVLHTV